MARLDPVWMRRGIALTIGIAAGFGMTRIWHHRPPAPGGPPSAVTTGGKGTGSSVDLPAPMQEQADPEAGDGTAAQKAAYDAYLERHHYSREALVAIALLSDDPGYLAEAAERYPDDPGVQLLVIGAAQFHGDKAEWYRRFRESQPDNLLAPLLLASHLFESGHAPQALEALRDGAGLNTYRDFSSQNSLAVESALIELGHSQLEAKLKSSELSPLNLTVQVQAAIGSLDRLADSDSDSGDVERRELIMLGAAIGNQLSQGAANGSNINRLFGLGMERNFLRKLDPGLEADSLSATPAEALAEIGEEWDQIGSDTKFQIDHFEQLNEAQKLHFLDRKRTLGEADAVRWMRSQFPSE